MSDQLYEEVEHTKTQEQVIQKLEHAHRQLKDELMALHSRAKEGKKEAMHHAQQQAQEMQRMVEIKERERHEVQNELQGLQQVLMGMQADKQQVELRIKDLEASLLIAQNTASDWHTKAKRVVELETLLTQAQQQLLVQEKEMKILVRTLDKERKASQHKLQRLGDVFQASFREIAGAAAPFTFSPPSSPQRSASSSPQKNNKAHRPRTSSNPNNNNNSHEDAEWN